MAWFCSSFAGPLFAGRLEEVATPTATHGGSIGACGGFLLLPLRRSSCLGGALPVVEVHHFSVPIPCLSCALSSVLDSSPL
ncbi:hypothetical protein GW17_00022848 [Ensete ventricosum]|uniref:Uncharacterized protein n=1 Tax=Ensete ventricosum TaxID=4639 RepID=A0A426ZML7_ENSVE|nr:hypothetical protein B296_00020234 [Ensete ventricosum]RWW13436.1 hypothetical protein GW17_00022848 [Ensete ventricosum]